MNPSTTVRVGAALVAWGMLGGCGGAVPQVGGPGITSADAPAVREHGGESWMAKGLKQRDLLYVSNSNGVVNVYRYWQHTLVGVLTNFTQPYGECADAAGNVYITDYTAEKVDEYAHGGRKPIKVYDDSPYNPQACAVDLKTGDLAVANYGYYQAANIAVYPHGSGPPTFYGATRFDHFMSCSYDDRGDLLALAKSGYSGFYYSNFYYLPKRGVQLVPMNLPGPSRSWEWRGVPAVAWDEKYWVIDDYALYRYTINVKATYVDTIKLSDEGSLGPVWIFRKNLKSQGSQVVGGENNYGETDYVDYWSYPAGGTPIAQITKDLDGPSGLAVSMGTP
ncbi:MAG: hypothetical protein WBV67_05195 [Candidatus Cybelea sp.]|jgi:hypothetical protein